MTSIAQLPMYDWPELFGATSAFWGHIRDALRDAGFEAPNELASINGTNAGVVVGSFRPNDSEDELELRVRLPDANQLFDTLENLKLRMPDGVDSLSSFLTQANSNHDIWRDPNMLFSQTCGYPYITELANAVHLLWRPDYEIEGCRGGKYRSVLVVSRGDGSNLEGLRGHRLAFNSMDSLSGFRCLSPLVGDVESYFGELVQSHAHRKSARMVAGGEADCAAIDAVCWDMLQRFEPETADGLKVCEWLPEFPALPFITSIQHSQDDKQAILQAVKDGFNASQRDTACDGLKMRGLVQAQHEDYVPLLTLS